MGTEVFPAQHIKNISTGSTKDPSLFFTSRDPITMAHFSHYGYLKSQPTTSILIFFKNIMGGGILKTYFSETSLDLEKDKGFQKKVLLAKSSKIQKTNCLCTKGYFAAIQEKKKKRTMKTSWEKKRHSFL